MSIRAKAIHQHLDTVATLRRTALAEPGLAERVGAVKRYQARRFERSYAALMQQPQTQRACRFFLDELYGAKDFSRRDAEFARVVPAMVKLFPDEISATVESLAALHALSEGLDVDMARCLAGQADASIPNGAPNTIASSAKVTATTTVTITNVTTITPDLYRRAWQATGRADDRERQISLVQGVGGSLAAHTRRPMLRRTLKFMRGPAAAAGLSALQNFLEEGFDAFAELPDARAFLNTIAVHERALMARLFAAPAAQPEGPDDLLAVLP